MLQQGDKVGIVGWSKGRGFQGVVKRWGFAGGPASHGSRFGRLPGSAGAGTYPGRVIKGKKFPGRMGNDRVTVKNLEVIRIDAEKGLIVVKGSVPGFRSGLVLVKIDKNIDIAKRKESAKEQAEKSKADASKKTVEEKPEDDKKEDKVEEPKGSKADKKEEVKSEKKDKKEDKKEKVEEKVEEKIEEDKAKVEKKEEAKTEKNKKETEVEKTEKEEIKEKKNESDSEKEDKKEKESKEKGDV